MKKKILSFILALFFVLTSTLTFSACKNDNTEQTGVDGGNSGNGSGNASPEQIVVNNLGSSLNNSKGTITISKKLTLAGEDQGDDVESRTTLFVDGKAYSESEEEEGLYEESTLEFSSEDVTKLVDAVMSVATIFDANAVTISETTNGTELKIEINLAKLLNDTIKNAKDNADNTYAFIDQLVKDLGKENGITGLLTDLFGQVTTTTTVGELITHIETTLGIEGSDELIALFAEGFLSEMPQATTWATVKEMNVVTMLSAYGLVIDSTSNKTVGQTIVEYADTLIKSFTENISIENLFMMYGSLINDMSSSDKAQDQYSGQAPGYDEYEDNNDLEPDYNDNQEESSGSESSLPDIFEMVYSYLTAGVVDKAEITLTVTQRDGKVTTITANAHFKATLDFDEEEAGDTQETSDSTADPYLIDAEYSVTMTFTDIGTTVKPSADKIIAESQD